MRSSGLGRWEPLDLATTVEVLDGSRFLWRVSGGRALELHVGRSWQRMLR